MYEHIYIYTFSQNAVAIRWIGIEISIGRYIDRFIEWDR